MIKAYILTIVDSEYETVVNATSVGKAKYEYWLTVHDCFPDLKFTDIRARIYGSGEPYSSENYKRVASYRGKNDIQCGDKVIISSDMGSETDEGYVVGHNSSANFDVYFTTGKYSGLRMNVHPAYVQKF